MNIPPRSWPCARTRSVAVRRASTGTAQHQSTDSPLLRLQAEAWVSEIIRPIRITAQLAADILASTVRFQEQDRYAQMIRPANMGFGVSYALPIIVAGLLTVPGDLLMVENPEAHLHPAGQSKLGRFLANVASAGAQVIVETHSDHVLNGARIAVADSTLSASDMIVHYFDRDGITEITINEKGELDHWPAGSSGPDGVRPGEAGACPTEIVTATVAGRTRPAGETLRQVPRHRSSGRGRYPCADHAPRGQARGTVLGDDACSGVRGRRTGYVLPDRPGRRLPAGMDNCQAGIG